MLKELQLDDSAPWKKRFRAPVILWTTLARTAPDRGVAASNKTGLYQLYAWDVTTGDLTQLTDRPEGQVFGSISPDGKYIYYLHDELGNEIGHYVRIPFAGGEREDVTPDLPDYSSFSLTFSHACNLMGFVLADDNGFNPYCIPLAPDSTPGKPQRLTTAKGLVLDLALSHSGELAAFSSDERAGEMHFSLLVHDVTTGQQIAELWDGPDFSVRPVAFSPLPNDFRLLATTNQSGMTRPLIWNPQTGERFDLALEDLEGEIQPVDWSPDGKRLLLVNYNRAIQQLYIYDLETATLTQLHHPTGTFRLYGDSSGTYFGTEDEIFAQWQDSTHPSQLIGLDAQTGAQTRTILQAGEVPASRPWKTVTFTTSDGAEIQGWLAVPEGEGPFPTILETHGGPTSVTTEEFSPDSQVWLDHGFAFMSINYRGSVTFGKEFQEKIVGDLGHWEVEDMVGARDWLVENGISDPEAILLTGWSYGGYLTLQGLSKRPDLWAGGMAGIAIADWTISYEESADTLRGYQQALFGGTPDEKPEVYKASSPITYAENVKAPVLIIQGRNDTRTPARPIEIYEARLKELGKDVHVHWFETGHTGSFANVELGIDHHERMLRFAYRVLG